MPQNSCHICGQRGFQRTADTHRADRASSECQCLTCGTYVIENSIGGSFIDWKELGYERHLVSGALRAASEVGRPWSFRDADSLNHLLAALKSGEVA